MTLLAVAMWGPGCAQLATTDKPPSKLPPLRAVGDAVALDVAFVRMPAIDGAGYSAVWQEADEQHFPLAARQQLAANGLRVGLVGRELPAQLRALVDSQQSLWEREDAGAAIQEAEQGGSKQHLTVRLGRRSQIYASKIHPSLPVLIRERDEVHGHQLLQARCLLALRPYPRGDGSVKLELTPEIEHGEEKSRFIAGEGQFLMHAGPERLVLDRLRIEAVLEAGQWLIVSSTPVAIGLGEQFFSDKSSGAERRTFILIRLAATQLDDLFAPEQTSAPLATPAG